MPYEHSNSRSHVKASKKLNDQIAKIVQFSWFGMKSVYFIIIKTLIWKLANNNNRFLYSAFPNYDQSASQCIITPVIGFRHNSALKVHFLHSLGSIPASRRFIGAHVPTQPQFRSHPTGSPFNTWVESSNVDKVSCWRTKVPCESGNRTRTLSVRVERSLHYTTAPPKWIRKAD